MKRIVTMCVLAGMAMMFVTGCGTAAQGPTDEEMIAKRIQEGIAAIKAKDFAAFDGFVSTAFSSSAVGDKKDLLAYLKNADDMGFLDGLDVDISKAKTVVTGNRATLAPVTANGSFGSLTLGFEGVKENGSWLISGVEPEF